MNELIKKTYDNIPLSIVIFKDEKIIHTNKYFTDFFSLLNNDKLTEKFSKLLKVKEQDILKTLQNKELLKFKTITLRYTLSKLEDNMTLFIFYPLTSKITVFNGKEEYDIVNIVPILSFYKGMNISSEAEILEYSPNEIVFKTTGKQFLNKNETKQYFFKLNNNFYTGFCRKFDFENNLIYLEDIKEITSNPFDRSEVRIRPKESTIVTHNLLGKLFIYDISEKSVSFITNGSIMDFEEIRKKDRISIEIPFFKTHLIKMKFLKEINIDNSGNYKSIFQVVNKDTTFISKWIEQHTKSVFDVLDKLDRLVIDHK